MLRRSRRRVDNALKQIRRPQAAVGVVNSPLGDLLVALSKRGIVLIHYLPGDDDLENTIAKLRLTLDPIEDRRSVKEVGTEIRRYLDGDADALRRNTDLSLVVSPFQKKVLQKLREVPRGAVVSYQALGAAAGAPKGARAVGNALHNNPVPIYVPCHRVITSSGGIGGYGGGAARKLQLLRSEGFAARQSGRKTSRQHRLGPQRHKNFLSTKLPHHRACGPHADPLFRRSWRSETSRSAPVQNLPAGVRNRFGYRKSQSDRLEKPVIVKKKKGETNMTLFYKEMESPVENSN